MTSVRQVNEKTASRRSFIYGSTILFSNRLPPPRSPSLGDSGFRRLLPADRHDIHLGSPLDIRLRNRNLPRLLVREPFPFVIPEDDLVLADALDVLGKQRNLTSTTRGVDHELRHRESRRPTAQRLNDLESLLHRRPE